MVWDLVKLFLSENHEFLIFQPYQNREPPWLRNIGLLEQEKTHWFYIGFLEQQWKSQHKLKIIAGELGRFEWGVMHSIFHSRNDSLFWQIIKRSKRFFISLNLRTMTGCFSSWYALVKQKLLMNRAIWQRFIGSSLASVMQLRLLVIHAILMFQGFFIRNWVWPSCFRI